MTVYVTRFGRLTRDEYDRLISEGAFHPAERIELLDGQLLVREPQGSRHAVAIELALGCLQRAFGPSWRVRVQLPIALDADSEPEPDLSVVPGDPRVSASAHPADPVLIVEVSDTSLAFDRDHKTGLYARARVPDFWIVNLVDRQVEVRRAPITASGAVFGWRYDQLQTFGPEAFVSPLAAPTSAIAVADLLP